MSRPGFYFCICPDAGLIKLQVENLIKKFPPDTENAGGALGNSMGQMLGAKSKKQEWQRHVYWGDEELPGAFWENLMLQGLFSTPKILVLRNAQSIQAAQFTEISGALSGYNPLTWLIICLEVPFEKGKAKIPAHIAKQNSFQLAQKKGWIWQNFGLDIQGIRKYIQGKASALGLSFEPSALNAFCSAVPADATAIDGELEKLILVTPDGRVTDSIASTVSGAFVPESDIFSFINQIYAGNLTTAWREIYRSQHDIEALLFPFLALLFRDAKVFWQILAGENVYLHPSAARMKEQYARSLGFAGIGKIFAAILNTELSIKNGEKSTEQSLESLVVELAMLFKSAQKPQY